jgi:hypothetical protein
VSLVWAVLLVLTWLGSATTSTINQHNSTL